jgi:electron transfer flavoprotein alpha subunit
MTEPRAELPRVGAGRHTALPEIWVWISRSTEGALHPALNEALYESSALARRLDLPLVAVADRPLADAEQGPLAAWGVTGVRQIPGPTPLHPRIRQGRSPFVGLDAFPRVFILLADPFGNVAAPFVAAESGAVYVPHAASVTSSPAHFTVSRLTLGGQYEALVQVPLDTPLVATLLPGSVGEVAPPAAALSGNSKIVALGPFVSAPPSPSPPRILAPQACTLAVSDADRIVAFGRGAFSREAVALVEKLADVLGATIAGTRPAADEGWLPFAKQVGLTGAIVTPKLYIAIGISGAPYHMVGVKDPETLIAINQDPEAPIFASAHVGLVGDLHTIVPALIARLEQGQPLPEAPATVRMGVPR